MLWSRPFFKTVTPTTGTTVDSISDTSDATSPAVAIAATAGDRTSAAFAQAAATGAIAVGCTPASSVPPATIAASGLQQFPAKQLMQLLLADRALVLLIRIYLLSLSSLSLSSIDVILELS